MTTTTATKLEWHKSVIDGYESSRGHVCSWNRGDLFAEATEAWAAFRVSRTLIDEDARHYPWQLRVWTCRPTAPVVASYRTARAAKEAAALIAQAIGNRYDGRDIRDRDFYLVDAFVEAAERAVSLWAEFPNQRDEGDVKRLAEVGIEVTL